MTIKEVESGTIDVVFNGVFSTLQFNCSCEDALPVCKAICGRMRIAGGATAMLEESEKDKFQNLDGQLLADPRTRACVYLGEDCKCTVHDDKPKICKAWHCSPGGKGEGIKYRSTGWLLAPMAGMDGLTYETS
jgi:Fe-S-cluster containining protein